MGAAIATVCAAYALKRFYSAASVEQLLWILQPVASLVSAATGCAFTYEAGFGFFAREAAFVIAPSCAGVNFMIVSACSLVFSGIGRVRSGAALVLLGFSLAYATTVLANTARILLALAIPGPAPAHRAEGIAVFLLFLFLQQALWERGLSRV